MDAILDSSVFSPLGSPSNGKDGTRARDWSKVFTPVNPSPKSLNHSHHPLEPEIIPFSGEKLASGGDDWKLCLVGYSIGRRPFYEAFLGAINKTWALKGSVQLLSLSDGFFLFRFSCTEDFDMVWSKGVWFILGKPFVFQKWHPKFKPKREDFKSVPIWVKIHDLPLACWNYEGISRIASKIGIPIAADNLTEQKTRLTFARICILVDNSATYPEEILVSLDGDVVSLKVQYEWRPFPCDHCKSLMHLSSSCPSKPSLPANECDSEKGDRPNRGRSFSRNPQNRASSRPQFFSRQAGENKLVPVQLENNHEPTAKSQIIPSSVIGQPLVYQPHSPPPQIAPSLNVPVEDTLKVFSEKELDIPNLNSPNEAASSSSTFHKTLSTSVGKDYTSPNKFDILNNEIDVSKESNETADQMTGIMSLDEGEVQDKNKKFVDKRKTQQSSVASKKAAKGKQNKKSQPQRSS
ncbi:hypothetical protein KFK09_028212 [Dendrobium nobile]|uniref:DUF4283 domain-containing protein n=1 Tax=Dendrobium nobile TaxID=94219 RepID=A0A8T3A2R6_DENNO|nr:hypothetical protein KFK09_028212 [Dendrobium nobile]